MDRLLDKYTKSLQMYLSMCKPIMQPDRVWAILDKLNEHQLLLLNFIEDAMDRRRSELKSRVEVQQAMRKVDLDTKALQLFYKDQRRSYEGFLSEIRKEIDVRMSPCVTQLSAKQMLLMLRLFRELEIIPQAPLIEHVTHISRHFSTPNQKSLSAESLRKKYSKVDARIVGEVKEILQNMIAKLDEYNTS